MAKIEDVERFIESVYDNYGSFINREIDDYSGRGMFGKETRALVIDSYETMKEIVSIYDCEYDNMGMAYVVYMR